MRTQGRAGGRVDGQSHGQGQGQAQRPRHGGRRRSRRGIWTVVLGGSVALAAGDDAAAQTELPEIVVQSASPVASGDPNFTSVTTVSEQELTGHAAASLGDALATKPGLSQTSFAPAASRPVIRGLGGFRVRTQENGIGSHDMANLGEDHAVAIDPLLAGQVEVIRGPGVLRYGSQAIGGVVSASNGRIPTQAPANGVRFESRGGFGSVSNGRDGAALLEAGGSDFVLHVDGMRRVSDDYRIPGGRQANSSLDMQGHAVGLSHLFDDGFVGVAYQSSQMTYFIPGIASAAEKNHIDLWQDKWTSRGEWRLGAHGLDAIRYWFGATDYRHHEVNVVGGVNVIGSVFKNRELESRLEVTHLPVETGLGELRGAFGVQWGDRRLSAVKTTGVLLAPAQVASAAAFLFEELKLDDTLKVQAAARIDRVAVDGTGALFPATFLPPPNVPAEFGVNRLYQPLSASVGMLYTLPADIVARVTAQHVERAPDAIELFYKGPHDTPRTFEIGDPNMRLEKADTVELGFKRAHGDFRFDVSAYHTRFTDFIFKNFTGVKCADTFASCGTPGATFDQIIYSQRNARFIGAEVQAEYDVAALWGGVWGVEAQYDFVDARFTDGSFVPKIPPHRLGGGVYYRSPDWNARVHLLHAFAQNRLGAFETPTAAYTLLNAELSYTRRFARDGLVPEITVGLRGENLLNQEVRLHQSYKKDEVLQPGLNVRLFASIKLN